ncbi:MAG: GAF domain-containing protein [Thermodesulfobacteriota bacterium]|nr:GAF domain-containing protein [Thermodesulfobacteriota bacterium]
MGRSSLAEDFEKLLNVGIALSSIHDLEKLLDLILEEARRLTRADAGTLYLVKNGQLIFKVSQCQSLTERLGKARMRQMYESFSLPISRESIAGYVALTKEVLNIADVREIRSAASYHYNPSWDERAGYITCSMLVVPMLNREEKVAGVLQLINAMSDSDGGKVIPFPAKQEKLVSSLASQAVVAIENAELTDDLKQAHLDTIFRLGVAAEYRDRETANHIKRMSQYCVLIAENLGWSGEEVDMILRSSLMHDVGKLGIPDSILQKPGRLTPEERRIMEYHTIIGGNIMKGSKAAVVKQSRIVAITHHEKFDGTGYTRGLKGEEIPVAGRITILADIFDALSSKRVYKEALAEDEVLRILREGRGSFFDPKILDIFLDNLESVRKIQGRYVDREEDFDKFKNLDRLVIEEEEKGKKA